MPEQPFILDTGPGAVVREKGPKACPGCLHSFHPAGKCQDSNKSDTGRCLCERNMAVELNITPPDAKVREDGRHDADPNAAVVWELTEACKAIGRNNSPGFALDHIEAALGMLKAQSAQPEERSTWQVLASLAQLGEEQLAELKHLVARASAGESRSSASVKDSTRGCDLEVKSYADGLLPDATTDAIESYRRGKLKLVELAANQWQETVDSLTNGAGA